MVDPVARHDRFDSSGERAGENSGQDIRMSPAYMPSGRTQVVLLALVWGLFYLLLGSENFIYADDSLRFALYVDTEPTILVHHLILPILYHAERILNPFAEGIAGTIRFLQLYVAATSVLALAMVGLLSLRWFRSTPAALLALCAVAASYGFWSYAIVSDFYVPAVAFVLLAIHQAERACREGRGTGHVLGAACAVLLAALNHQAHSLVVLPVAAVLFLSGRGVEPMAIRRDRALLFFGATGLLGLGAFYIGYLHSGDAGFFPFVKGYSGYFMMTPYDRLQPLTPVYVLVGIVRTIFFPEILLGIDAIFDAVHRAFPLKVLIDDRYLIRGFPPLLVGAVGLVIALLSLLIVAGVVRTIMLARRHRTVDPGYRMTLLWTFAQAALFCWWEPISNEFWIWLMPALALLMVGPLWLHGSARLRSLMIAAVIGLLLANLPVISRYWSSENCIYWINKSYAPAVGPDDLVLTANFYQTSSMDRVRLQSARRHDLLVGAFVSGEPLLREALERVEAQGGAVILDPMLGMPEATEMAMRQYYTKRDPGPVDEELRMLEDYCRERRIPIYAIERKGGEIVRYSRREFNGYLRWIAPETTRASLDTTVVPADRMTR